MQRRNFIHMAAAAGLAGTLSCSSEKTPEKAEQVPAPKAVPPDPKAIHARILTLDSHDDIQEEFIEQGLDLGSRIEKRQVDLVKMEEGGLDAVFFAVWTPQEELAPAAYDRAHKKALRCFDAIRTMCEKTNADRIELALSPDDVVRIGKSGKKAAMIGVENGYPLGEDIGRVSEFYDLGARYITLTHMGLNQLGDSSNDHKNIPARKYGGLTDFGKAVILEMNRLGIIVDVSHVSRDTFYDALVLSKAPVIASHSGCRALCDVHRDLDDYQLRAIKEKGGVMQLVACKGYVKLPPETADLSAFVDHIDHAVEVMGIDHVGIGADFDGGGGLPGFMDASECPNVTVELVKRGYSEEDIGKIWSGNFLRVWREVERIAGTSNPGRRPS